MKKVFIYINSKVITAKNWLIRIGYKIWGEEMFIPEPPKDLPLNSLSPVMDADQDGVFGDSLYWALKNRREKDIKNIAITGPYGSGKSSLLKTFQEKHKKDTDLKFLNISLATFKEEKESNKDEEKELNLRKTEGEDLLRLIELSILQQLFYFEKDQKIPDSRFKKIRSFSRSNLWISTFLILTFTTALTYQISPCFIHRLLRLECETIVPDWLHYTTLFFVVSIGLLFVFKSIRSLRTITIKSLKLQDTAEFEIGENINKSILNHHIDEILYFFEVTSYTVVIIEDLDRFEQTEIFTKLRELNLLINHSKKIKRDIVFIYAVRDELFRGEKERTKFFDFILPIIPVINSSNSGEKLIEIVDKNSYSLKKELIEDVSLFVDDMRLLYNIMNEFHLYAQKLGNSIDQNKLFAMMVYKNLYPDDFVELSNGNGSLYQFFTEKDKLLKQSLDEIDVQIADKKEEIKNLNQLQIVDASELRKLYLLQYISQLSNIKHFEINETEYDFSKIDEMANDENIFKSFIENEVEYTSLKHSHSNYYIHETEKIEITFETICDQVDPESTYFDRLEQITDFNKDKTELLRKEISDLEKKKNSVKNQPLKILLQNQSVSVKLTNNKQQQLVSILLRNGYIDEHYHDYISIFYEGSITKDDREFLLNVKAQLPTDHDYQLSKIENLIGKIALPDFERTYILNYHLVDELFKNKNYINKRKAVLRLLTDESLQSFSFINGFLDHAKHIDVFIRTLATEWPNYWKFIQSQSTLTADRVRLFLQLLLEHADIKSISAIEKQSDLTDYLAIHPDFFQMIDNQEKLKNVVEELDIQFERLNFDTTESTTIEFLHIGNYYRLNVEMVQGIVKALGKYDESKFLNQNFYAIQHSECDSLSEYIHENIDDYIRQVYLKLENNREEVENTFIELINHEELSEENKKALIQFTNTKVTELENIENLADKALLLFNLKVESHWENLIHYYSSNENKLDNSVITFLNDSEVAKTLSKTKIDKDHPKQDLDTVKQFLIDLLQTNQLSNEVYESVLKSIPFKYNRGIALTQLSVEKQKLLISKRVLNLTEDNYNMLRSGSEKLHLELMKANKDVFLNSNFLFELDSDDFYNLLISSEFSFKEKSVITKSVDQSLIISDNRSLKKCGEYCLSSSDFRVSRSILKPLLMLEVLSTEDRIKLFNINYSDLTTDETREFLTQLPEPYSEIAILGKRPTIIDNTENRTFLTYLKELNIIKDYTITNKKLRVSTFRK